MKKYFSLVLALVMALSLTTMAWGAPLTGAGTAESPYEVGTKDDLADAIAAGGYIKLTDNIPDATSAFLIKKDITIDGDGHTITSSATRVFRLTTSDIEVVMEDLNIVSTATASHPSNARGVSIDATDEDNGNAPVTDVSLTMNDCSVTFTQAATCYAVNLGGGADNIVAINGGSYMGTNVINVWGDDHVITIDGATLTSNYPEDAVNPEAPAYIGACVRVEGEGVKLTVKDTAFEGDHACGISDANPGTNAIAESDNDDNSGWMLLANGSAASQTAVSSAASTILYAWNNASAKWVPYYVATGKTIDKFAQDSSDNCLPCYLVDGEYFVEVKEAAATCKLVYGTKTVYLSPVDSTDVCYEDTASVLEVVAEEDVECGDYYVADATYDEDDVYYVSYDKKGEVDGIWVAAKNGSKQILVKGKIVDAEDASGYVDFKLHDWKGYDVVNYEYTTVKCDDCGKVAKLYANKDAATVGKKDGVKVPGMTAWITYADYYGFGAVATTPSTDKVTSAETFDAGIAMYVGMSVMAAAGSAVVLKKKD